jgi:hypothetical protein
MLTTPAALGSRRYPSTTSIDEPTEGWSPYALPLAVILVLVMATGFSAAIEGLPYRDWAPFWVLPLIGALTLEPMRRCLRAEPDPFVRKIFVTAILLKALFAVVSYATIFIIYKGVADANNFDSVGSTLAALWRSGHFTLTSSVGGGIGTSTLQFITGVLYTITGSSELSAFFVFSWLGFWGMYFFYRAGVVAFPQLDRRRYAALLFFWPSMIYWSSALSKDAWSLLFLGIATYGVARIARRLPRGWVLLAIGAAGVSPVRANMTLQVVVAAVCGYTIHRWHQRRVDPAATYVRMKDVLSLGGIGGVLVGALFAFKAFFHLSSISPNAILSVIAKATAAAGTTKNGASKFAGGVSPQNILEVLFRPLPFQATSATSLLVSFVGLALIFFLVAGRRRLLASMRLARCDGFAAYCLVYIVIFVITFSAIADGGALDRERIQVLPFLFVFLSMPPAEARFARQRPPTALEAIPRYARPSKVPGHRPGYRIRAHENAGAAIRDRSSSARTKAP